MIHNYIRIEVVFKMHRENKIFFLNKDMDVYKSKGRRKKIAVMQESPVQITKDVLTTNLPLRLLVTSAKKEK